MADASDRLNYANLLTGARALLIIPHAWMVLTEQWWLASLFFVMAWISDVMDGKLARRFNQSSAFGGVFDHATDAVFVTSACWALAANNYVNGYLAILIPLAFIQYLLDSNAIRGSELKASYLGRINGIAYFVLVGIAVIGNALLTALAPDLPTAKIFELLSALIGYCVVILGWALCVSSLISILDRGIAYLRSRANNK